MLTLGARRGERSESARTWKSILSLSTGAVDVLLTTPATAPENRSLNGLERRATARSGGQIIEVEVVARRACVRVCPRVRVCVCVWSSLSLARVQAGQVPGSLSLACDPQQTSRSRFSRSRARLTLWCPGWCSARRQSARADSSPRPSIPSPPPARPTRTWRSLLSSSWRENKYPAGASHHRIP